MLPSRTWALAAAGAAMAVLAALPSCAREAAQIEKDREQTVTIDQVPPAVRAAILKEAGKNQVREIEKEIKGGKTVYEAEWAAGGKQIEIKVAEDGTLIGREEGKDDDDDDEKGGGGAKGAASRPADGFQRDFAVNTADLADTGDNPYLILRPGYRLVYRSGGDEMAITVLSDTKVVDGVRTRVVEELESKGDRLAEVSRNYFAIDRRTKDVYYFGEDVEEYRAGRLVSGGGAWLAGQEGAKFGLMMPGKPAVGQKFYQELAPGKAMDRCEIVSLSDHLKVPAGEFANVLCTRESLAWRAARRRNTTPPASAC